MKVSRFLLAGVAIATVLALSAAAGYSLAGEVSDQPAQERPADASPCEPGTAGASLPDGVTNAWDIPAFHLRGLDGKTHRLGEWKGKVILLNFWATWCGPCQYEIRDLVTYQDRYASRGLQIIGIGLDGERKLRNVARTLGINYPVLIADPVRNPGLSTRWGNSTQIVPYTVIIDRDGCLKYLRPGRVEADAFEQLVLPMISSPDSIAQP